MTKCCGFPAYSDPMFYDETNCRFGVYARCAKCHRLYGEAKIGYTAPSGLRSAWTALSEVWTREHFSKDREGRPMRFVMDTGGLKPLGFKPAQPEMTEQEP